MAITTGGEYPRSQGTDHSVEFRSYPYNVPANATGQRTINEVATLCLSLTDGRTVSEAHDPDSWKSGCPLPKDPYSQLLRSGHLSNADNTGRFLV